MNLSDIEKLPEPKSGITLVNLETVVDIDPRERVGSMRLVFGDTLVTVKDPATGKELGAVKGCVGGGVQLCDHASGFDFYLDPRVLWSAFQAVLPQWLEAQGMKLDKETGKWISVDGAAKVWEGEGDAGE